MAPSDKDQEQSMEEILQSIKRIIAEEDAVPQGSDVLELTDIIDEPAPAATEPYKPSEDDTDLSALTIDEIMALKQQEAQAEIEAAEAAKRRAAEAAAAAAAAANVVKSVPPEPVVSQETEVSDLISEETFKEAAAAFEKLKHLPDDLPSVPHVESMSFRSGTTVEDLVLEALRPMLREWLDAHLVQIVERLVEREVRKIAMR